jgi:hypothetical protein
MKASAVRFVRVLPVHCTQESCICCKAGRCYSKSTDVYYESAQDANRNKR